MNQKKWHLWVFASLVFLVILLRYPFWASLSYSQLQGWSALSLTYAQNWLDEGFFYLRGVLYNQPGSVEYLDPSSRIAFHMPSVFFVLPIFWISKLSGLAASTTVASVLSLLLQLLLAYGAGALSYSLMDDFKEKHRKLAFLGAVVFVLFAPKLFITYTLSYWSDLLVLPFIVFILLIEQNLQKKQKNSNLLTLQQFLIFFGCLSDLYGFIFALCLMAVHTKYKDWQRVAAIAIPFVLALGFTSFYVSTLGSWEYVRGQILADFGLKISEGMSLGSVLSDIFVKHLGVMALVFLLSFGIAEYLQRKKLISGKFLFLLFAPPLLSSLIFATKSMSLDLSALKYYVPCAVIFFGILPALFSSYADALGKKKKEEKLLYDGMGILLPLIVLLLLAFNYSSYLDYRKVGEEEYKQLSWIKGISRPEQIIFSNKLVLNYSPVQSVYLLRKPIWKFADGTDMRKWRGIFRDVTDYPLLWLDMSGAKADSCEKVYKEFGATSVSTYKDIRAYLFPSVEKFVSIPDQKLGDCLVVP